jgi:hypothetical protein
MKYGCFLTYPRYGLVFFLVVVLECQRGYIFYIHSHHGISSYIRTLSFLVSSFFLDHVCTRHAGCSYWHSICGSLFLFASVLQIILVVREVLGQAEMQIIQSMHCLV